MTNETARPRRLADTLSAMVSLTPAQHALLERISRHAQPVTVAQLAQESDLHVSSVRETLEGLLELGLIEREQLPAQGRGRPALGYSTSMPADPAFAAQMLGQFARSVFAWLRTDLEDPAAAARSIGHRWADAALSEMNVPEHNHREVAEGFSIAGHMGKVRLFLTAMGFGAQPRAEDPLAVVLTACPFAEADAPDGLAFELRRGIVERVFERTATGVATWRLEQDDADPMVLVVRLEAAAGPRPKPLATTLRFFGGAAEAAGCDTREIPSDEAPATLGALVGLLRESDPALAPVLDVSSYLVNERSATLDTPLAPGARVDVLPPFAGG